MRIGIITLNSHANYGGILQAYALAKVLADLGHNPKVIYLPVRWSLPWYKYPYVIGKRVLLKILGREGRVFKEKYNNQTFGIVSQHTQRFIDEYVPHVVVGRYEELSESDWDGFVVGSDQVWRPDYMGDNIKHAFLQFANNWDIKRIAYAPSFGKEQWMFTDSQTKETGRLLRRFDAVSVREKSGVDLCKQYWQVNASHVIDPTMLIPRNEYELLVRRGNVDKSMGNLLCYVLDENETTKVIIETLAEQKGLTPFRVNSKYEDFTAPISERIQPPVEQWLRGFMDAYFVVTDSFHACVFSIIFNKPFLVIGNKKRGLSRFESLLSIFNLSDRLVCDEHDLSGINETIDWAKVNAIKESWASESMNFLKANLQRMK